MNRILLANSQYLLRNTAPASFLVPTVQVQTLTKKKKKVKKLKRIKRELFVKQEAEKQKNLAAGLGDFPDARIVHMKQKADEEIAVDWNLKVVFGCSTAKRDLIVQKVTSDSTGLNPTERFISVDIKDVPIVNF